jgi:hypothetical protein
MTNRLILPDTLLADLTFQVRWHFTKQNGNIAGLSPLVSGPVELGMQEPTEIPTFLGGFSETDLFEVDFIEAKLTTGETVQIIDYFSKARSRYFGRAFVVDGDIMMEKPNQEGWTY